MGKLVDLLIFKWNKTKILFYNHFVLLTAQPNKFSLPYMKKPNNWQSLSHSQQETLEQNTIEHQTHKTENKKIIFIVFSKSIFGTSEIMLFNSAVTYDNFFFFFICAMSVNFFLLLLEFSFSLFFFNFSL